jgi:2-methylcitrate dehydratase PrpD
MRMTLVLKDGRRLETFVEHAIGSSKNPMSDAQLEAKFKGLTGGILPAGRAGRVLEFCWKLEQAPDASELARLASVT